MIKFFLSLSVIAVSLISCSKDKITNVVNVRLENATTVTMDSVTVGSNYFGQLVPGELTAYKTIKEPLYAGYCNYKKDSAQLFAGLGICGSPMPPAFEPGFYTFKIEATGLGYSTVTVTKQ